MAKSYLDHDPEYIYPDPDSDLHYALPTAFEVALQKLPKWAGYWRWNGHEACPICEEQCSKTTLQIGRDFYHPDCGNQAQFFAKTYPEKVKVLGLRSFGEEDR